MKKNFVYHYNLDNSVKSLTYPSGRTITYAYSAAARALSAVDTANGINYATSGLYTPQGALSSLQNGANIVSTFYYNSRLQPCRISVRSAGVSPANCADSANIGNVLDFTYNFNLGTANNGNVASITNNRAPSRSPVFTYDQLNRLASAQTTSNLWGNTYGYDIWGNLLQKNQIAGKVEGEFLQQTVNANNRINGLNYDAAGNQTNDGSGLTFTYDAENRLTTVGGITYTYDGDGQRVKKSNGKLYWYGIGNDPLAESDLSGAVTAEFIFFNSKRAARLDLPGATVHYYFADHLGSASVVTNAAETTSEEESDYYPWGRERVITDTLPDQNYKFTGKERDTRVSSPAAQTSSNSTGSGNSRPAPRATSLAPILAWTGPSGTSSGASHTARLLR